MPALQLPAASRIQGWLGLHGYDLQPERPVPLMKRPLYSTSNPLHLPPGSLWSRREALLLGGGLALATAAQPRWAHAQTQVPITKGDIKPIDIAIPAFVPGTPQDAEAADGVTQVITNNLRRSGLFNPIDPAAYVEKITSIDVPPQFNSWRQINAQALVTGRITRQGDGRLKAEFRLWDVFSGQQLTGQQYFTAAEFWRRIG